MATRPGGYTRLQIRLHWATVLLVALQIALHDGMADAWDAAWETGAFAVSPPVVGHFVGGTLILTLAFWRLLLRNEHGAPKPPATGPGWSRTAARALHLAFYGLLVLLPVTGALAWGMPSAAMGQAHEVLRVLLILAILAHVGAALLHQFVWKDATLRRMVDPVD